VSSKSISHSKIHPNTAVHRSGDSMDSVLPSSINSSSSASGYPSTPPSKYHSNPTSPCIRGSPTCTPSHKKSRSWLRTAKSTLKFWRSPNRSGVGDENASPKAKHHRRKSAMGLYDTFRSRTASERHQGQYNGLSERPRTASPSKNTCTIGEMRSKKPTDEMTAAD
jgi:hypothetical protein